MNNGTRFLFALPVLISGGLVLWLVLAAHQMVAGPQEFLTHVQQIGSTVTTGKLQSQGLTP